MITEFLRVLGFTTSKKRVTEKMEQTKQGNHSLPPNLLTILRKLEKTFTEKSDPVFLDENAKKLTMKEIHNKECVGTKPITMIAVSRHQYDVAKFPKYANTVPVNKTPRKMSGYL